MKRLKQGVLKDNQLPTSSFTDTSVRSTGSSAPSISSSTDNSIARFTVLRSMALV